MHSDWTLLKEGWLVLLAVIELKRRHAKTLEYLLVLSFP